MLWFRWIWWCWFLGHDMTQRFILCIKHPVNFRWLELSSLLCRQFQGTLLHPLRFCAGPHVCVTADSKNQHCFGRFQQLFSWQDFCPKWKELKNLLFRPILGTVAVIKSSLTHFLLWVAAHSSLDVSRSCMETFETSSLGHFWWRTKWLPGDNEGLVMATWWQYSLVVATERPFPKAVSKQKWE